MFAVAGHIFDARAKKLLVDSAAKFTSPGWAAEFQDHAQHEILQKKMKLSRFTRCTMRMNTCSNRRRHRRSMQRTRETLRSRSTSSLRLASLDPKIRLELEGHVDKITQMRPLYEALRTGNIADMADMLPALGDPKQFTKMNEEERVSFTHRFEAEIKGFQDGIRKAGDAQLKANADAGWNGIFVKERGGQPIALSDIPAPGTVPAEAQKEMIKYVNTLNKGEKPETDWTLYAGLLDQTKDRQKFAGVNLLNYRNRLADPEFKQLLDLQMGLKGGNGEAYDHFVNTDEAISVRLAAAPYNIDVKDKDKAEQIGYVKTQIQRALAREQESNGGKPLAMEVRDRVIDKAIKDSVDPKKEGYLGGWAFGIGGNSAGVPAFKAGVPPTIATTFQRAVSALYPKEMGGDFKKRTNTLAEQYADYSALEPTIEKAWSLMRGKSIDPHDAVQAWYYIRQNRARLEGSLRQNGELSGTKAEQDFKVTSYAIYELLQGVK
jgi:hypothetical protein